MQPRTIGAPRERHSQMLHSRTYQYVTLGRRVSNTVHAQALTSTCRRPSARAAPGEHCESKRTPIGFDIPSAIHASPYVSAHLRVNAQPDIKHSTQGQHCTQSTTPRPGHGKYRTHVLLQLTQTDTPTTPHKSMSRLKQFEIEQAKLVSLAGQTER